MGRPYRRLPDTNHRNPRALPASPAEILRVFFERALNIRLRAAPPHVSFRTMKALFRTLCALVIMGMALPGTAAEKLQHVVCFKFKAGTSQEQIQQVGQAFAALKEKIPQIVTFEQGTNVSKEQKNKGFTHCFLLSFRSEEDRDAYIAHPAHKAFGKLVGPVMDDVFVIDYWAKP